MEKYKDILSVESLRLLEDLLASTLTHKQYHAKKTYARRTGDIKKLINLTSAWEVYKIEK